jgi:hypothetical protein
MAGRDIPASCERSTMKANREDIIEQAVSGERGV